MLKTNKSTTLSGYSEIDGQKVVSLNANITQENAGNTYISQNILNARLYSSNRAECREDVQAFQDKVWFIEDEFLMDGI